MTMNLSLNCCRCQARDAHSAHVRSANSAAGTPFDVTSVRLDAPGIGAYADGELVGLLPVEVSVVPSALRILTPAASPT